MWTARFAYLFLVVVSLATTGCGALKDFVSGGAKSTAPPVSSMSLEDISPKFVAMSSGQSVTITGSGFTSDAKAFINNVPCLSTTVISSSSLLCATPPQTEPGVLKVTVSQNSHSVEIPGLLRSVLFFGQPDLKTNIGLARGLWGVGGAAFVGSQLWVSDDARGRILKFANVPTTNWVQPDSYMWQRSRYESPTSNNWPEGIASDGVHFAIADRGNNRVLIWNSLPTTYDQPADVVIGQQDLNGTTANVEGVTARTLSGPRSVAFIAGRFLVIDSLNNRVLIWNAIPTTNFQPADMVLGQANTTSSAVNNGGRSASTMAQPFAACGTNLGKLVIADRFNNRVLIWDTFPTSNGAPATRVLGQSAMTSGTINQGGLGSATFSAPSGCYTDGTRTVISDSNNNRVLIWDSWPTINKQAANVVLGQPNFTTRLSNAGGLSASTLSSPFQIASDGTKLIVGDEENARFLIWNTIPTVSQAPADVVVGQPRMTENTRYNPDSDSGLSLPESALIFSGKLFLADSFKNRILVWNSLPTSDNQLPDYILGQSSLSESVQNRTSIELPNSNTLYLPGEMLVVAGKFIVVDRGNHRVLIWNSVPTSDGIPADVVLGQSSFTVRTANAGGLTASTMYAPRSISSDGTRLAVADSGNGRVLIWNSIPTSNGQAADIVLGQTDFVSGSDNNGGISASSLNSPTSAVFSGGKLIVSDFGNSRLLIWNSLPTANGQPADVVIGQSNFTSGSANQGLASPTDSTLSSPFNVSIGPQGDLYVGDSGNHRILKFPTLGSINSGTAAKSVIGQTSVNSSAAGGLEGLNTPGAPVFYQGKMLLIDRVNGRLLITRE